ncbi:DUF1266 domain-containing protein [Microbacterium sp. H83]|uniref:DUF1266 domain-containing protein n=1 Tax=Microbacterium sp. H83 TaxID=1827324 RepID=UPI0007F548AE|nr:DUF1266 domain-containing protein [Microbacterium sp. H83]OAN41223.1 hypothetical protein A4X16_12000 [Microbacterium sp. H83]
MSPLTRIIPAPKLMPSPSFSTTDIPANEIALGFLQIRTLPSGPWNDPTAPGLGAYEQEALIEQWGVGSRHEWLEMIEYLTTVRRRREDRMLHLAVRNDLAIDLGRVPRTGEWLEAIASSGSDPEGARAFIEGISLIELRVRRRVGIASVTPETFVRTLDGYAVGQAVAMATWGVAMGFAEVPEVRQLIHRINIDARRSFTSWADFGLSYLAGRVMHWSDGVVDEDSLERYGDGWSDMTAALSAKRGGPWATLPWTLAASARLPGLPGSP